MFVLPGAVDSMIIYQSSLAFSLGSICGISLKGTTMKDILPCCCGCWVGDVRASPVPFQ